MRITIDTHMYHNSFSDTSIHIESDILSTKKCAPFGAHLLWYVLA